MNTLVIAAHPDDEVLGCGGTIARSAAEGERVTIAILGQGAASRHVGDDPGSLAEISRLAAASRNAAAILGAAEVRHFGLPDNRFDSVDLLDVVKLIEALGDELRPGKVYVQHGGDLNIDHAITFRAAMTAFRPLPLSCTHTLLAYEVASSTEWAFGKFAPAFVADTFIDISSYLDIKLAAMNAYIDELREFPHPRSPQALRMQAGERGSRVGMSAAEAFATIWRRI